MRDENGGVDLRNFWDAERGADGFCGFLARGNDSFAMGQLLQETRDIRWFHDFEEFIRGVVLKATDSCAGVEKGEALLLAEGHNLVYLKTFGFEVHEMILIAKEYLALNAPVVVDEIRVVEVHTPPLALGWKTAQEQHLRILRQERT